MKRAPNIWRRFQLVIIASLISDMSWGQVETVNSVVSQDTSHTSLPEVVVTGYLHRQFLTQVPTSVAVLGKEDLDSRQPASMVSAMNSVPGVRMEERSPASYRLSIRGNVIRSPYGVRNVKIYYDGFSLTDAGGNTYLNLIDPNVITRIEILKGPDGSLFGANSGGVVFLNSENQEAEKVRWKSYSGSYGLAGSIFHYQNQLSNNLLNLNSSYQRADGYRKQSFYRRLFIQLDDKWRYSRNSELNVMSFFSGIHYETPGGLTKEQFDKNPRMARPATKVLPGSEEQHTGSFDNMFFLGISDQTDFSSVFDLTAAVWESHVSHRNYAIPNYENDRMNNIGFRSYLSFHKPESEETPFKPSLEIGTEGQLMFSHIHTYDNNRGEAGAEQSYSDLLSHAVFGFIRSRIEWKKFVAEMAFSLNFNGYHFRDTTRVRDNFNPVLMPHFALSYKVNSNLSVRATVSKGYSVPTTEEVRPSDQKIYKELEPETGWNFEGGLRLNLFNKRLMADASVYRYLLNKGIVSQQNELNQSFFINAGKIKQTGIESSVFLSVLPLSHTRVIRYLDWNSNYTYSFYHFGDYLYNNIQYSGNRVPGVPRTTIINNMKIGLPLFVSLWIEYQYSSRIPLNSENGVYSPDHHLLSARISYNPILSHRKFYLNEFFVSFDNILNRKYSLGYDINAYGGRYYNAAPGRNFQIGVIFCM